MRKERSQTENAIMNTPKPNDGGPAFPMIESVMDPRTLGWRTVDGMSLRAYIATAAMQGIRANSALSWDVESIAIKACQQADALITELSKGSK